MSLLSFRTPVLYAACYRCGNALTHGEAECPHCGTNQSRALRAPNSVDYGSSVVLMPGRLLVPYPSVPEEIDTAMNIARERARVMKRIAFYLASGGMLALAAGLTYAPALRSPVVARLAALPEPAKTPAFIPVAPDSMADATAAASATPAQESRSADKATQSSAVIVAEHPASVTTLPRINATATASKTPAVTAAANLSNAPGLTTIAPATATNKTAAARAGVNPPAPTTLTSESLAADSSTTSTGMRASKATPTVNPTSPVVLANIPDSKPASVSSTATILATTENSALPASAQSSAATAMLTVLDRAKDQVSAAVQALIATLTPSPKATPATIASEDTSSIATENWTRPTLSMPTPAPVARPGPPAHASEDRSVAVAAHASQPATVPPFSNKAPTNTTTVNADANSNRKSLVSAAVVATPTTPPAPVAPVAPTKLANLPPAPNPTATADVPVASHAPQPSALTENGLPRLSMTPISPAMTAERPPAGSPGETLYIARLALITNDLSAARKNLAEVPAELSNDAEAKRIRAELAQREAARDTAMQHARACDTAASWRCARRYAKEAIAIDTSYPDSRVLLKRANFKAAEAKKAAAAAAILAGANPPHVPVHTAPIREAVVVPRVATTANTSAALSPVNNNGSGGSNGSGGASNVPHLFAPPAVRTPPRELHATHEARETRPAQDLREPAVAVQSTRNEEPAGFEPQTNSGGVPIRPPGRGDAH
jgi:hypothetical protein